jgi:hypothetical protein
VEKPQPAPAVDRAVVLTKAVLRVADLWALKQDELGELLGVSGASVSRLANQQRQIVMGSGTEWQLAALLVRIFRSLDSLVGGDSAKAALWLRAPNRHLGRVPLEAMKSIQGMVNVAEYLDAMRGKV